MTNFPHFDVKKSIIKKFFLAHKERPGKYDLKNLFGKYYISSNVYFSDEGVPKRLKHCRLFCGLMHF